MLFGKIDKLDSKFSLKLPRVQKQLINSLKDIRNCLAHSNGVVRAMDGQRDEKDNATHKSCTDHKSLVVYSGITWASMYVPRTPNATPPPSLTDEGMPLLWHQSTIAFFNCSDYAVRCVN